MTASNTHPRWQSFSALMVVACLTALSAPAEAEGDDFFETKVRPVLADNCLACHGDAALGGLRLDSREGALQGGASGPSVIPGDPDGSLLMLAVRHEGEIQMPKGGKLKAPEIAALGEWIRMGAPWPSAGAARKVERNAREFWSFQPLAEHEPPTVDNHDWPRGPIDQFVLAKLEEAGLQPVADADRRTLIRRVTYDLTGLPPTAQEVEDFAVDESPTAYEDLIERLLASRRYGERWGRHWLDVVRFGEDDMHGLARTGYEFYDNAFRFRDWVIRSFNRDMPFDVFLKAHLAGDQMEERLRPRTLPGIGFLGQGPWYYDNGDPPVVRSDERHERVDTITRAMLGLTVGCARCHDHKYDPIPISDYYSLTGVFYNTAYFEHPLAPKKAVERWKEEDKKIEALEKTLSKFTQTASEQLAEVLAEKADEYMIAAWKVTGKPKMPLANAAREAALDHELLQRWVAFLAKPPLFYPFLKDWQTMIQEGGSIEEATKLAKAFRTLLLDVMIEQQRLDERNEKILAKKMPLDPEPSIILPNKFKSFFDRPQFDLEAQNIERLNLWTDVFKRDMSAEAVEAADPAEGARGLPGLLVFRDFGLERQLTPEWNAHVKAMREEIERRKKANPKYPFIHGVVDVEEPKPIQIHERGSPYSLGDPAPAHFLGVLSPSAPEPFTEGSGRMELAEAIVATPLAARVLANRVWKWHFGEGLVETPSNFGQTGERPSHPELLDYLASRLRSSGWSLKKLHREILLSRSYQLSGAFDEAKARKDPENRLHWRFSRRRLSAEEIRDSILLASGSLDETPGGPSQELDDLGNRRRTVYGRVSRFKPDPFLQLFDFPNPTMSSEARLDTNVPVQRLYFLNSDFLYEQSTLLAESVYSVLGWEGKVLALYRKLFQREASDEEVAAGIAFVEARQTKPETSDQAAEAEKPVQGVEKTKAEPPSPWASYAHVLLSSNELLYVD